MFSLYKLYMLKVCNEQLFGCCSSGKLTVPCLGQLCLYCDDVPVFTSRVALFVDVT